MTETLNQKESISYSTGFEEKVLHFLPLIAFLTDVFTPILILYGIIPAQMRWLSDLALAAMLGLVVLYILTFKYMPKALLLIIAISLLWIGIALLRGQGPLPTVWGWWQMFKYPFVGLFVYLYPGWPPKFARSLPKYLVILLGLEFVIQVGQFLSGVPVGDSLAGSFGNHGVGTLMYVTLITLSMALGVWFSKGDWKFLLATFILGIASSALAEIKMFAVAIILMVLGTALLFLLQGKQFKRLWLLVVLSVLFFASFIIIYNMYAPELRGSARIETYLDIRFLDNYLNARYGGPGSNYYLGRNFALTQGWNSIKYDPTTLLFGYGMGSRSESVALGAVGQALSSGYYGNRVVSSLLSMLQEYGIVGLGGGLIFMLWIFFRLYQDSKKYPNKDLNALRYGLILFTLFWPIWLWYATVWTLGAPMVLYWSVLGYTFNREIVAYFSNEQSAKISLVEEETDPPVLAESG